MNNARKALIGLFISIIIVSTLVHTVLAQKNETIDILQQENKTTIAQNTTFSEVTQKGEVTKEEIIIEAQRSFDRSLSILNIVATSMGVLVGIFALIVAVAAVTGYFGFIREIKKMQETKQTVEQDVKVIKERLGTINELQNNAEKIVNSGTMKTLKNWLNENYSPAFLFISASAFSASSGVIASISWRLNSLFSRTMLNLLNMFLYSQANQQPRCSSE